MAAVACAEYKLQIEEEKESYMGRVVLNRVLAETADQDAYLCNSCENELVSIRNLEKIVGELKVEIVERLSKLHPAFSIFRVEPQKSIADTWKRTLKESSEVQPLRKKLHLWLLVGIYASFQQITSSSSSRSHLSTTLDFP